MSERIVITPEEWARLQRIALQAPQLFPDGDGAWLAALVAIMASQERPDLQSRDEAMRDLFNGWTAGTVSQRLDEFRRLCRTYETGRWRYDRDRQQMPAEYAGSKNELLFRAFRANGGCPPLSTKTLRAIFASACFYKRNAARKLTFSLP